MSKNKFGSYNIGQTVLFENKTVKIIQKFKGNKTNNPNRQNGIITGLKSKPCLYKLDNGYTVRGDKLKPFVF